MCDENLSRMSSIFNEYIRKIQFKGQRRCTEYIYMQCSVLDLIWNPLLTNNILCQTIQRLLLFTIK